MFRHNQMDYLRTRIATEDQLAETCDTLEQRRIHAELAIYYRAEMRALLRRQEQRCSGITRADDIAGDPSAER